MAMAVKGAAGHRHPILDLPPELHSYIFSYLPNSDIKSLRLTCRALHTRTQLRLNRLFLSANPLNISVFRAVVGDETFRHGITEIVWDDALFPLSIEYQDHFPPEDYMGLHETGDIPDWYSTACQHAFDNAVFRQAEDEGFHYRANPRIIDKMSLLDSWTRYQQLLGAQDEIIASKADSAALRYALPRLPNLRRITLTTATYGWIFNPFYETPLVRSLPSGFIHPVPRGWPNLDSDTAEEGPRAESWDRVSDDEEAYKNIWRGFRLLTKILGDPYQDHTVTEFVVDTGGLECGLNVRFLENGPELTDLSQLLRRPGFNRLDLALIALPQAPDWKSLATGQLRQALSEARGMQRVSLRTTAHDDYLDSETIPLRTIFPVDHWRALRHFGLLSFHVVQSDLVSLLAAMPTTLRSVELAQLVFCAEPHDGQRGSWRGLLYAMRDELGWRHGDQPNVSVAVDLDLFGVVGRAVWFTREIYEFLYADRPLYFEEDGDLSASWCLQHIRDDFGGRYGCYTEW